MEHPLGIDDVRAAAKRIEGHVVRTPVLRNEELDASANVRLWLKCEQLQHIGAFKARGAFHAVARLRAERPSASGLATFSSGNHGQAVAWAARSHGLPALIVMPEDAAAIKVASVRRLGAEVVFAGTTSAQRREVAEDLARARDFTIIPPFDDANVIAGAGTAALELVEQVRACGTELDAILVPVGGGGLLAGSCLVAAGFGIDVVSVEPSTCDAFARSLAAGERILHAPGPTLADGLKPVQVGALNFEIARRTVARAHTVEDEEIGRALVRLLVSAKCLVEPSGAAALSYALRGELGDAYRNVGVLLSGGNIDPAVLGQLIVSHAEGPP